jgi:hypothetical protein
MTRTAESIRSSVWLGDGAGTSLAKHFVIGLKPFNHRATFLGVADVRVKRGESESTSTH